MRIQQGAGRQPGRDRGPGDPGRRRRRAAPASRSTPTPTPTRCSSRWPTRRTRWAAPRPAETYLDIAKILDVAARERGQRDPSRLRLPGRERRLRPGGDRRRPDLDRSAAGGDRRPRRQGAGPAHRPEGRRAAGARHPGPGGRRRRGAWPSPRSTGCRSPSRPRTAAAAADSRWPASWRRSRQLFESATREAVTAFGRGECFVERYLDRPRHVETQCLADTHGNVVVVSTRDCSLQRRHQKLVEEAPAPFLSVEQTDRLYSASKAILTEAGYVGAGTCEFLVGQDGTITFLEVNTRLQVEHPVSEEVTGLDLVREMFRIAEGEPLGYRRPGGDRPLDRVPDQRRGRRPQLHARPGHPDRLAAAVRPGRPGGRGLPGRDDRARQLRLPGGQDHRHRGRPRPRPWPGPGGRCASWWSRACRRSLPFHRAVLDDPAFTAADGHFGVHTRWIETEFAGEIAPYAGPAEAAPEPVEERPRSWSRSTASGSRWWCPPASARATAAAAARAKKPARRGGGGRPARPRRPSGNALTSPMQGTDRQGGGGRRATWSQAGDLVVVLEAMKMEQPLTAHRSGTRHQPQRRGRRHRDQRLDAVRDRRLTLDRGLSRRSKGE